MADSIREQIIANIVTTLGNIKVAGGYNTNAGNNVDRVRSNWETTDVPCISVFPGREETERKYGEQHSMMLVTLILMDVFGAVNPSIISEKLLADAIKCMGTVNGKEDDVYYIGGGVETYPVDGDTSVGVNADFTIKYYTAIGNPYSQT